MLHVVGHLAIDRHFVVDRIPQPNQDATILRRYDCPGGAAGNVAAAIAAQGGQVCLVSCVGNDALGQELRSEIAAHGVGVNYVSLDPLRKRSELIAIKTEAGDRSFLLDPNSAQNNPYNVAHLASLGSGEDWCFVGCQLALAAQAARMLRAKSASVALGFWVASGEIQEIDHLLCLVGRTRIAFLNAVEFRAIPPNVNAILRREIQRGLILIITDGGNQVRAIRRSGVNTYEVPALSGVVDTTGCGDAFMGAFLAASQQGEDLDGCVKRGIAQAARIAMNPSLRLKPSRGENGEVEVE